MTQRTASITFDLPQPFGTTTEQRLEGKSIVVGSTKDLKPANLMHFRRMNDSEKLRFLTGRLKQIGLKADTGTEI